MPHEGRIQHSPPRTFKGDISSDGYVPIAPQRLSAKGAEPFKRSTIAAPYDYGTPQRVNHVVQQHSSAQSSSQLEPTHANSMSDHLMNRRVRFANARHQQVLFSKAVHATPKRGRLPSQNRSQSMPSKSNLRHVTPKRGRLPSQNRSTTPQRGHFPHHQVRPITPQRGHLPNQQMRPTTPQRGQVPSQHSQSLVSNKVYLPRQMSPRDAPTVVFQPDISTATGTSSSYTRISENLSTEPVISDTSSVTNASIAEVPSVNLADIATDEQSEP
uniref:thioredoxin domain-containing protein 2-like n=1 Tax=Erigeron canadensis TaxID=72917 RepID=UPI001CB9639D|nr:thioredoxin domain-containing protein 2-like [Erigeron canadensis]